MTEQEVSATQKRVDDLFELYIKIGGYIGVSLAVIMFFALCGLSYWLFILRNFAHMHSAGLDIFIVIGTLIGAAAAAVGTFFCASVFWLPIIIGLCLFLCFAHHFLLKLHH